MIVTDQARLSGLKEAFVVLAANTAGRARATPQEDAGTRNDAWAWARLRGRFNKNTGATCFNEVFQCSWSVEGTTFFRRCVARLGQEGLDTLRRILARTNSGELTISGLARHDQAHLENHLRLRATLSWQDVQTHFVKYMATIYCEQPPQPTDFGAVTCGTCQAGGSHAHSLTSEQAPRLARSVVNVDTWQLFVGGPLEKP